MPKRTQISAALLAGVLFLCVLAIPANAAVRDSDGNVPVRYICHPNSNSFGFYIWDRTGGASEVRGRIVINRCALEKVGAGPRDYRTVYRHELAHAHGLDHWQGSPKTNAAYYPFFRLCRC